MPLSRAPNQAHLQFLKDNAEASWRYRFIHALETVYRPRSAQHSVGKNQVGALYDFAGNTIGRAAPIFYMEFGVFEGDSMARIAERFSHPQARFFGFDSFEGLPEDWVLPWGTVKRSTFATDGNRPVVTDPRISFIAGWFQNSVPSFLRNGGTIGHRGPFLVHFDADLYSSTLFLLSTLWHFVDEYYFIFDEYLEHEQIALDDFAQSYPVDIEFLCQTNADEDPCQVFGRLKRVPFQLAVG